MEKVRLGPSADSSVFVDLCVVRIICSSLVIREF